ncbi:MAG: molecular chaperone GroEL [Clostridia bacterium]|nr:molecular chaperone GroEL [Clostridia bacterium]
MAKEILLNESCQSKMAEGVNKLANLVKLTLGPKGKNVVIDDKINLTPIITNDGVTIAKNIELSDKYENIGVKLIKEVSQKTNLSAGDGTTTATVLAQNMLNNGLKLSFNKHSCIDINKGIDLGCNFCIAHLEKHCKKINNIKEIENIAFISCQDEYNSKLISQAYKRLGKDATIILQDSPTSNTYVCFQDGLRFNSGFISQYFCNNPQKTITEFNDCFVLIYNQKLSNFNKILGLLDSLIKANKPLLIICDDIDTDVLSALIVNKIRGNFDVCVVKAPAYADKRLALLEDIACLCNTTVFNDANINLEDIKLSDLGTIKQAKIDQSSTTITSAKADKEKIKNRTLAIKTQMENAKTEYEKDLLKMRISNLIGGIATIYVGGQSDVEQAEKKYRIEDAISATASALEKGIVSGGGIALLSLYHPLKKYIKKIKNNDQKLGAEIILSSLKTPITQILLNADLEPSIIINKILNSKKKNYGYDASKNIYTDMIQSGIIDPVKVTISAIKNATSIVKMMLTTGGIICDE